jgi:tetratricopeptide (TPR) repeat protein
MLINPSAYFEISARDITSEQSYSDSERPLLTFGFKVQDTLFEKPVHKEIRLDREITSYKQLELDTRILKDALQLELNEIKEDHESLTDALKRLEESMRQDVRFLYKDDKEDKEMLRRHYVNINQEIGEKVIKYYYDSFEHFYNKNYYKSIEVLQQAIILDPYMPQLYSRLGSIYFELDLPKEALEAWNHALKLDPNNQELRRLIRDINK